MNFKLFKKIIINLLKFVHFLLGSVVNLLIRAEDKLITLRIKVEAKRTKIPNSMHHYLGIDELYTENIGDTYTKKDIRKTEDIDYTMIKG
jgi:hypothetical protein